ncbi:MAG: phosphoheptose isomerase [Thiomargarita sp.]|nr:phosphoheptose isomerase [Thiomargarita sp.]
MNFIKRINQQFSNYIDLLEQSSSSLAPKIEQAGQIMVKCLHQKHKILACGNGGSAAQAQHFAAEIVNRFETERVALPVISLTTDSSILTSVANDYAYENIFSRQIEALGNEKDILLVISTSGNSANILQAIKIAQQKNMLVISLNGRDGGQVAHQLRENDMEICVSHQSTARIQEVHLFIIHCLCEMIDLSWSNEDK